VLSDLLSKNNNFLPTEEVNEALKQLALIFPRLELYRAPLDAKLAENSRRNTFLQAKLLLEAINFNFSLNDQNEINIPDMISSLKDKFYEDGFIRGEGVDTCIAVLQMLLTYIGPEQYPFVVAILAYRICNQRGNESAVAAAAKNLLKAIIAKQSLSENLALAKQTIPHFSSNSANFFPKEPMLIVGVLTDVLADKKQSDLIQIYFVAAYLNYLKNKKTFYNNVIKGKVLGTFPIDAFYGRIYNSLLRFEQTAASENVCYLINRMISHQVVLTIKPASLHGNVVNPLDIIANYASGAPLSHNDYSSTTDRREIKFN
jgi:hypothetical protein